MTEARLPGRKRVLPDLLRIRWVRGDNHLVVKATAAVHYDRCEAMFACHLDLAVLPLRAYGSVHRQNPGSGH